MNPNIRKKTILKRKLMKTTMFSTAIFVAVLFIGSSVAASLVGNDAATKKENNEFNELSPNIGLARINNIYDNSKDVWDLQGSVDVEAPTGSLYCAGCEAEGSLYTCEWNAGNFYEIDTAGSLVRTFTISGASSVRDMAFDGTYFYGGNSGSSIYEMDFSSETLVSTIVATGTSVRAIAYNGDTDTFYVSNWGDPVWEVDRSGAIVSTFNLGTTTSTYGFAYNDGSLWVHDQGGSGSEIHEWDIASGAWTGVMHDVNADFPSNPGSAGGLFITDTLESGFLSIGGFVQAAPDTMFWYELDISGPLPDHDLALKSINAPASGTGSVITPEVTIQNKGNNSEYSIPVTMEISYKVVTGVDEGFEGTFPPAGWTEVHYGSATGNWTNGTYGSHSYEPAGTGSQYLDAWDGDGTYSWNSEFFTPASDLTGVTTATLVFERNFQDFAGYGEATVKTYSGVNMTFEEELLFLTSDDPSGGVHTELIFDPSNYTDPSEVYIGFWYTDDDYGSAWGFGIDDVFMGYITWVLEYSNTIYVDVPWNTTITAAFPDWTPIDLGLVENVDVEYFVEAEIIFVDNNSGNNYKDKGFTLHYGYFNDIGINEIISPVDGSGATQTPEVIVENFGQHDQTGAGANMIIEAITYTNQWTQTQYSGDGVWERSGSSYVAPAYGSGYFMVADSDAHSGQTFDVEMFTHSMDMTGETSVDFYCAEHFQDLGSDDTAQIGIYSGGVLEETAYYQFGADDPYGGGVVNHNFDPTNYTDITDVQIGFYYSTGGGTWDWGFAVDDILLTSATATYINWDFEIDTFPPSQMSYTTVYDETETFDIDSGATLNVILPDFIPPAPLVTVDYCVTATAYLYSVGPSFYSESFEGYFPGGPTTVVLSENFSVFPPTGWTIQNTSSSTWFQYTYSSVEWARCSEIVGEAQDEWLISPTIDCTAIVGTTLSFEKRFYRSTSSGDSDGHVYVSGDNGSTWTEVAAWYLSDSVSPEVIDISAIADGNSQVKVAFNFVSTNLTSAYDYFRVTDVTVSDWVPASGFPPAGWTQVQYGGTGWWTIEEYPTGYNPPEGTGLYFAEADSDEYNTDVFDVGLFTNSIDLSGKSLVAVVYDRNFQDYAGDGYMEINTYSGGTDIANFEENLYNQDTDDPYSGVANATHIFDPSGYAVPSDVYIEFYYSTQGGTYAWKFSLDDVDLHDMTTGDGDPSNDMQMKFITLEFLHDVGTVSIDEPTGTPVITKGTLLYEDMEGTWIPDLDGDPYMVPEDATFGAWDIDGLCIDSQAGYPQLTHYISQMADYGGYGLPYEGTYCAGAWWSDGNGGDGTQDEWLKTPDMDLSGYSNLEFSFYGIWNWASTHDDHVYIKASTDGGTTWDTLADLLQDPEYEQGAGGPGGAGWCWNEYEVVIDLSAYDQSPSLIIAYQILGDPTMAAINYIDAIKITGDVAGSWEPGTFPVEATIENFGDYDENNFDVTAQIFLVGVDDPFYNESYTVTTAMSPGDQESIIFPNVTFTDDDEGVYTLEVTTHLIGDEVAGNDQQTLTFTIDIPDIIPPVTTHEFTGTTGDNDWFVSDITIIITGEDDGKSPSGIKAIYYSYDNVTYLEYTEPIVHTDDGEFELYYYAEDNAGNVEAVNGPFDFQKDATPPTIDLTAEGSGTTWTLIADAADETSDIAKVEFYVNDEFLGEVTSAPYEWEYTGASSGDIAQAIAYDNAGNSKVSDPVEAASLHSQSNPVWQVVQQNGL
jgi:hypothetical protein